MCKRLFKNMASEKEIRTTKPRVSQRTKLRDYVDLSSVMKLDYFVRQTFYIYIFRTKPVIDDLQEAAFLCSIQQFISQCQVVSQGDHERSWFS